MRKEQKYKFDRLMIVLVLCLVTANCFASEPDTIGPILDVLFVEYSEADFTEDEFDLRFEEDSTFATYDCTPSFPGDYFTILPAFDVVDENEEILEALLDTMIVNHADVSVSQIWYAEDSSGNRTTHVFKVGWEFEQAHEPLVSQLDVGGNEGDPNETNDFEFCEGVPIAITYNHDNNCSDQLSFRWHVKGDINAFSNQKLITFEELPVGNHAYELKIKGDFFGGSLSIDFDFDVFPAPRFEIDSVECAGDCNGGIEIIADGGVFIEDVLTLDETGAPVSDQLTIPDLCASNYNVKLTTSQCSMEKLLTVPVKKDVLAPVLEFDSSAYTSLYTGPVDGIAPEVSFDESSKTLLVEVKTCEIVFPYTDFSEPTVSDCDASVELFTNDVVDEDNLSVHRTYQAVDNKQNSSEYHVVISFANDGVVYTPQVDSIQRNKTACESNHIQFAVTGENKCSDSLEFNWLLNDELVETGSDVEINFPGNGDYDLVLVVKGYQFGGDTNLYTAVSIDGVEFSKTVTNESCRFPGEASIEFTLTNPLTSSFAWCDGSEGMVKENLSSGAYCFTVFDSLKQCEIQDSIFISQTLDLPQAEFFVDNPNPIRLSDELVLMNSSDADEQFWFFGDTQESTSTASVLMHAYTDTGSYTITLIAKNGSCADTAMADVVIHADMVPVDQLTANSLSGNSILLYPNPANEILNLRTERPLSFDLEYSIFSLDGKVQLQGMLYFEEKVMETSIELSGLKPGIYHIVLTSNSETIVARFIIARNR